MTEPIVISFCNSENENMHPNTLRFIETLKNKGWNYRIVGSGVEWKGVMTKLHYYLKELEKMKEENKNHSQIVVLSDARDVYCMRNNEHFETALNSLMDINKQILVSMELFAEAFFNIYKDDSEYFQVSILTKYFQYHQIDKDTISSGRKFVNSGLICGQIDNLIDFLNYAIINNFQDDQKALGSYMNEYPERVIADFDAKILHSSGFGVNAGYQIKYQINDSPNFAEMFGRSAYFLHIPGISQSSQKEVYDLVYEIVKKYHDNLNKIYPDYHLCEFFSDRNYWHKF